MIFVAVGTQLSFDRLIEAVDTWSGCSSNEVVAQVGTGGKYKPENIHCYQSVTTSEFAKFCSKAEIIVAHAGMGVILTARETGKPLVIMPRIARLKEHRNDHQCATAKYFGKLEGIYVADDAKQLHTLLDSRGKLLGGGDISGASKSLINRICSFIDEGK